MTDWIMIAITAVYVIATIFICIFQVEAFADTEFIRGNAPKIEETRIETSILRK